MTANEQSAAIIADVMRRRTAQGLKLVLQTPDGEKTLYPQDHVTLQCWIEAAERQGYVLVEGGVA